MYNWAGIFAKYFFAKKLIQGKMSAGFYFAIMSGNYRTIFTVHVRSIRYSLYFALAICGYNGFFHGH